MLSDQRVLISMGLNVRIKGELRGSAIGGGGFICMRKRKDFKLCINHPFLLLIQHHAGFEIVGLKTTSMHS